MNNFLASKKLIWVFAAIGLLAIAGIATAGVISRRQHSKTAVKSNNTEQKKAPELQVQTTTIDNNKLPINFPTDLPIEANTKVTKNFIIIIRRFFGFVNSSTLNSSI